MVPPGAVDVPAPRIEPSRSLLDRAGSVALDIGGGVLEAPKQALGGSRDALQEANEAAFSLGSWLNENVADLGQVTIDGDGVRWSSGVDKATPGTLPEVGGADTTTGGLVRGVSQFVTGFLPMARALGVGRAATMAGNFGRASVAGAITDATVFDPHEERLSNLVERYPALRNPVTGYLQADPSDSEAEGRFKNAVEGLGLGTLAEGLFQGVRALKVANRAKRDGRAFSGGPDGQGAASGVETAADTTGARPAASAGDFAPGEAVTLRDPGGPIDGFEATVVRVGDRGVTIRLEDGREFRAGRSLLEKRGAPDAVAEAAAGREVGGAADGTGSRVPEGSGAGVLLSERLTGGAPAGAPGPLSRSLMGDQGGDVTGRLSKQLAGMTPDRMNRLAQTGDDAIRSAVRDELRGRGLPVPDFSDLSDPVASARLFSETPPTAAENRARGVAAFDRASGGELVRSAMFRDDLGPIAFDFGNLREQVGAAERYRERVPAIIAEGKLSGNKGGGRVRIEAGGDSVTLRRSNIGGRDTWTADSVRLGGDDVRIGAEPVQRMGDPGKLPTYKVRTGSGGSMSWRGPMDLLTWVRTRGGLWDEAGELKALDLSNDARKFAPRERFLGPVVRGDLGSRREAQLGLAGTGSPAGPDLGMTLDDAARAAWEAGYFGARPDRPTVREFLDLLDAANRATDLNGSVLVEDDRAFLDNLGGGRVDVDEAAYELGIDTRGLSDAEAADKVYSELGRVDDDAVTAADYDRAGPPSGAPMSDQARSVLDAVGSPVEGGRAGNIRLAGIRTVEDIQSAIKATADQNAGFGGARRGVVSDADLSALADDLGMRADQLQSRAIGQAYNAEELFAARRLLADSTEDLVAKAQAARGGSDEALAAFQEAYTRHVGIQEAVSGATAEAGRALRQFRLQAQSERQRARVIKEMMEASGGRDRMEELADKLAKLNDPTEVNKLANDAYKGGLLRRGSDMIHEYWINSLLSGPTTHTVNITSNALTQLWGLGEEVTAAGIGAVRRGLGDRGERVFAREAGARVFGLVEGVRDAFRAAGHALRTGEGFDSVYGKLGEGFQPSIPGLPGTIIRIPTRLLEVEDTFFKAMAMRSELNGLAAQQAAQEGLKGDAFARRVAELKAKPTVDMTEAALYKARVMTFTNPLGPTGRAFSNLRAVPGMNWVIPFVKTPTNIISFAARRSPFAPLSKAFREEIAKGGAARDRALAQITLGTATAMAAFSYAREGLITGGGPSDPKEKSALYATGWQPYSMKIGDKWYAYDRLDPAGLIIGVSADMAEVADQWGEKDASEIIPGFILAFATTLKDKSYLRGVSDAINAVDDPDRYGGRWLRGLAGSFVPNVVGQYTRAADPTLREVRTFMDELKARTPGYSDTLFPRRDVWGEPIVRAGGLAGESVPGRIITPTRVSGAERDPVTVEVMRLDLTPAKPSRTMNGVELTPAQYDAYQRYSGRLSRMAVEGLQNSPQYRGMGDGPRRFLTDGLMRKAREAARALVLRDFPEIQAQGDAEKRSAMIEGRSREKVEQ